ncbi:MAG: hypothetical protein FJ265_02025 [Planctomycetes bacterium]|nr:hypothetical protein [Planctomycetota bacterium]
MARIDAAFRTVGLLLRAAAYGGFAVLASHYDCGRPILTGLLCGDVASRLVQLGWRWRDEWLPVAGELALLGLVALLVRPLLCWPEDPAMRGIATLAAIGAFVAGAGGSLCTRLGRPGDAAD